MDVLLDETGFESFFNHTHQEYHLTVIQEEEMKNLLQYIKFGAEWKKLLPDPAIVILSCPVEKFQRAQSDSTKCGPVRPGFIRIWKVF